MPEPGPGEVRVRVHRSGVNPTDWKSRRGSRRRRGRRSAAGAGPGRRRRRGRGRDRGRHGAGRRSGCGSGRRPSGVPRAPPRSSRSCRPAMSCALPDEASFDLGACLGIPFLTAHRCLTVTEDGPTRLGPGTLQDRVVLVAGGAGAVGNAAIQLARWSDATVISTVSGPAKAQLAVAAGRRPRHRLPAAGRRRRDPQARADGVHTIVEVSPAANAAHRRCGDRPARLGRDIRQRRRRRR